MVLDDVAIAWDQRPQGLWFGPNIRRLEQTLRDQTPFVMRSGAESSGWEIKNWSAARDVLCITGR